MSNSMIKSGFLALLEQVSKERNIPVDKVIESIESAIEAALRKDRPDIFPEEVLDEDGEVIDTGVKFTVELDREEGSARVFRTEGKKKEDVTPAGFGRIASQTAKNVIFQKVREAERDAMLEDFEARIGTIAQGVVVRYDGRNAVVDLGRGQAMMPPEEQMRGEFYKPNLRLTVLIKEIRETFRGRQVIVSRADKDLIVKLFEREVPELASGAVQIKGIAREAGVRTKMAVFSDQSGVDPVGSCVGQRGVRVQEVIREVNNEKIDIIPYSTDIKMYLSSALAPSESLLIDVNSSHMTANVTAPDDQISLAIGRGGQNVRLASKLTGYQLSVKSASGNVRASVTGNEEYEIDQVAGITAENRAALIDMRITTLEDLRRKWGDKRLTDALPADQLTLLETALDAYKIELEKEEAKYALRNSLRIERTDRTE